MATQKKQEIITTPDGITIMPRAAKPSLTGRPKPAPQPKAKKQP